MNATLEFWLLNLAQDLSVPLNLLPPVLNGDDRESTALNVRSLRGVSLQQGISWLVELAERGLVAFNRSSGVDEEVAQLAPSTAMSLLKTPGVEREISFELTECGGSAWETAAEPRWHEMAEGSAILKDRGTEPSQWEWTWFSQDRDRLMASLGWHRMIQDEHIDLSTVEWTIRDAYPVRYWKRLSNVHVVTFDSRSAEEPRPAWPRGLEPRWFTDWRISRANWYRQPWDAAVWPPLL